MTELYTPAWEIENNQNNGFYWLGEGLNQGLRGFLWSEKEIPVRLLFQVMPGPGREDNVRNLLVGVYQYGVYGPIKEGSIVNEYQISSPQTLEVQVTLRPGLNEFRIYTTDQATIVPLPNGDDRALLVMIDQIDVLPAP